MLARHFNSFWFLSTVKVLTDIHLTDFILKFTTPAIIYLKIIQVNKCFTKNYITVLNKILQSEFDWHQASAKCYSSTTIDVSDQSSNHSVLEATMLYNKLFTNIQNK